MHGRLNNIEFFYRDRVSQKYLNKIKTKCEI